MKKGFTIYLTCILLLIVFGFANAQKYVPEWTSLKQNETPQWLQEGKFGIYTHWDLAIKTPK